MVLKNRDSRAEVITVVAGNLLGNIPSQYLIPFHFLSFGTAISPTASSLNDIAGSPQKSARGDAQLHFTSNNITSAE